MLEFAKSALGPISETILLRFQKNVGADYRNLREVAEYRDERIFNAERDEWQAVSVELSRITARRPDAPSGAGSLNHGDRRAIYYLIRHFKPRRVLEIGTHLGVSALHIAAALKENGSDGTLLSVDLSDVNAPETGRWRRLGANHSPQQMIEAIGMADRVVFRTQDSSDFFRSTEETFDFLFLDGSHAASSVYRDIQLVQRILRPQAVVLLHDYYPGAAELWSKKRPIAGPWLAVTRLRRENVPVGVHPLGSLPWSTKAGTRTTSLALLGGET